MTKYIETTGKTREDAVRAALEQLGLSEEEVSVEVIALPKSGFLGFGSVPARVRVSYTISEPEAPVLPTKAADPKKEPRKEKKATRAEKERPSEKKASPAYPADSREARTTDFLAGLFEHMGIACEITVTPRDGGGLGVKLEGPNMGAIIGRRGETLDAIQHLVNYAVNRGNEKHAHISVDAEDYRSKREDSLVRLAEKMAAKAIKYKRSMALEPMNSYERHVIHTALQNREGITTSSTGTEPNRRVVVNYERPVGEPEESRRSRRAPRRAEPKAEAKEESESVKEQLPPSYPEGYEPPAKNKPHSREWC